MDAHRSGAGKRPGAVPASSLGDESQPEYFLFGDRDGDDRGRVGADGHRAHLSGVLCVVGLIETLSNPSLQHITAFPGG